MPVEIGFAGVMARCRQWVHEHLEDGPQLRAGIIKAALGQGYNESNIVAAARQLGVISERVKLGGKGGWRAQWRLPDDSEQVRGQQVNPGDESIPGITEQLQRIQGLQRTVDVYRMEDGEPGFLDSVPANEVTLRTIKRRWGGGRYQVEGVAFVIAGPPVVDGEVQAMRPRGTVQAPGGPVDTNTILMQMLKQQGDVMSAVMTAVLKGGSSQVDPVALFRAMDDAIGRRLEHAPAAPATPVQQALDLLEKGIALGRESADTEEPGERGLQRAIGAVAPFLNALASRMGQQQSPAGPALPPGAVPPREESVTVNALARVMVDLGPAVPQLLEEAKKGTDPKLVVDYILEHATDAQYDALAEASESPQFVDDLVAELVRRVPSGTNAGWAVEWFRAAGTYLNDLLTEDRRDLEQPAAPPAGDNGVGAGQHPPGAASGHPPHRRG